jgi:hypothetical protein
LKEEEEEEEAKKETGKKTKLVGSEVQKFRSSDGLVVGSWLVVGGWVVLDW